MRRREKNLRVFPQRGCYYAVLLFFDLKIKRELVDVRIPQVLRSLREHVRSAIHEVAEANFLLRESASILVKVFDRELRDAIFLMYQKLIIRVGVELNRAKIDDVNRLFDNGLSCFKVRDFEAVVWQARNKNAEETILSNISGFSSF